MNQNRLFTDEVGVIILDLEVIDLDRRFENLMLYLLNNDIFAVGKHQYIACAEVDCIGPAKL